MEKLFIAIYFLFYIDNTEKSARFADTLHRPTEFQKGKHLE